REGSEDLDLLAHLQGRARSGGRAVATVDAQLLGEQLAIAVDVPELALDELEARADARLLVEGHDVVRRPRGDDARRLIVEEGLTPDQRDRGLGVEGDELEAGTDVLPDATQGPLAAPGDELVEV